MLSDFYKSTAWESFIAVLKHERVDSNGDIICEYCGKPIVKKYDCIAHHKKYLTEENYTDALISLNPDNIAFVHHKCHNILHNKTATMREALSQRQVYIVYGSPLSGKSSWVRENMNEGDLVIDMDSIWQCVSGCDRYTKPKRLNAVVFAVRDNLLESVKYRRGKWSNCYVVATLPLKAERERLSKTLGAREIYIECPYEECIKRLEESKDGRDVTTWKKYIDDWWAKYNGGY